MKKNYLVERMDKDEVNIAIDWAANEGWNPGLHDAECFYQTDPNGFFAGKLDGKIIAVGSAVIYDERFAFCGFYIVDKIYRGQGYGLALTKARLASIGQRNVGLDGVTNMLDKYAQLGYKFAHNNARYSCSGFHPIVKSNKAMVLLKEIDFNWLLHYDRQHFPAERAAFLRCWINQPDSLGVGYLNDDSKLAGYGVIRTCRQGYKIGPLFADNAAIADELFIALASYAQGKPIYLDIPENNPYAKALVQRYQLERVFETARMYLRETPSLPMEHIYGITSFELG
ncbi:TPA: GNAT family N-acetyltransferase [Legionella feeleii]